MRGAQGLLEGLRVLDLSLWQPGHTATQLLADLGADVLKVEPPGGDRMRVLPERFANFNGHKRSLVLDLKQESDRARLLELAAQTEVVVEGFRPGVADRLGAGYERLRAVNPGLVYCSISGFGQTGPLASETGHEFNYQAYAGVFAASSSGGPPTPAAALVGDQGGGTAAAFAILAAVLCARRTGEGERIDLSITDLLFSWAAPMGSLAEAESVEQKPAEPGMGVYATAEGRYVVLGVFSEDHFWDTLCRFLDLQAYVGLGMDERSARAVELTMGLQDRFSQMSRAQLIRGLTDIGVPIAPVLSRSEALQHPHFQARGVIAPGPQGDRRIAHPINYARHPARPPGLAPALGQGGDDGFGLDE